MQKPQPSYHGDEPYVFVSYSHTDIELAYAEIAWLQDHGFNVWWDEGISPGSEWSDVLADAIQGCATFLYFITPRSVKQTAACPKTTWIEQADIRTPGRSLRT